MKTIAYAAASLLTSSLLLACPASAQMPGGPGPGPGPAPGPGAYETGFQDGMRTAMTHMGYGGGMMEHKGMHGMGGPEEGGGEPGSGPRVRLAKGNSMISLKCATDDSTEDCVNAAIILLDHAAAEKKESAQAKTAPQQQSQPSGPGTPPAPPPPSGPGAPQPH